MSGTLRSPTHSSPLSGRSSPIKCRRNTDLPVPEGPSTTVTLPLGMSKVMSSSTVRAPKDFVRLRIRIAGGGSGSERRRVSITVSAIAGLL
jgi:hypothetical protein